jgi:3-methyladenine DNA glycosylase/8-oxoguanine DNA glycosylase
VPTLKPVEIAAALRAEEPRLGGLIELLGPPPSRRALPVAKRFDQLAVAILHQQLAGKAAATITARARAALGSLSPETILAADPTTLRSCGVSGAKQAALEDLATKVSAREVDLAALGRRSDDEVIDALSSIRGIGRWTAEMFLMGPLGRHDVWPIGDLGVRAGWALIVDEPIRPPRELAEVVEHLRPWRSSVAWYCWQAVDVARSTDGSIPREVLER